VANRRAPPERITGIDYFGSADFSHDAAPAKEGRQPIGVVLANLGTPDAPDTPALRRYLREFLLDPRVIELPRPLWWLVLHLAVLPFRPRKSAELYRKVWTAEGSPLLTITRRQAAGVAALLAAEAPQPLHVRVGMRYGNPSVRAALRELAALGCRRIAVLPLYPQYAAVTTGSTFDAVAGELAGWRWVPELRMIHPYHDDPAYIEALAASVRDAWAAEAPAEKLLFSFHGIPRRYFLAGDPYFCHCQKTARLVAARLELPRERYEVTFQSLFGREEWLRPYTEDTIRDLAANGVRSLDVICPGFSADCLETLEEIDGLNREIFHHAGGERYRYIPALNDRPDHLRLLADLVLRNLAGWDEGADGLARRAAEAAAGSRRAAEMLAAER
jgi:ferrochelatase